MSNIIDIDITKYRNIVLIEKFQHNKLDEFNYKEVGKDKSFFLHGGGAEKADLVLELYKGKLYIKKNRYGSTSGQVILSDDEMAKILLLSK